MQICTCTFSFWASSFCGNMDYRVKGSQDSGYPYPLKYKTTDHFCQDRFQPVVLHSVLWRAIKRGFDGDLIRFFFLYKLVYCNKPQSCPSTCQNQHQHHQCRALQVQSLGFFLFSAMSFLTRRIQHAIPSVSIK